MKLTSLHSSALCPRCQQPVLSTDGICKACMDYNVQGVSTPNLGVNSRANNSAGPAGPPTTRHASMGEKSVKF